LSTVILGTSRRGPIHTVVPGDELSRFGDTQFIKVDLSTSGDQAITDIDHYYFHWSKNRKRKEDHNYLRTTGNTSEYRLLFPVIQDTVTVTAGALTLSATTSTNPGTLEYYLYHDTGLFILGSSASSFTVTYECNNGRQERLAHPYSRLNGSYTSGTISWSALATTAKGEYWLAIVPTKTEESLVTAVDHARLDPTDDFFLVRTNEGAAALCTITCSGATLVLKADPGPEGNNWRAAWDTDCIHILRGPDYEPRRWMIPLSSEAAARWGEIRYPVSDDDLLFSWGHMIATMSGTLIGGSALTPSSSTYSGGSLGSTAWTNVFDNITTDWEVVYIPLGADNDDIQYYMDSSIDDGYWPVALIGSIGTAVTLASSTRVGYLVGQCTYTDNYVGSPLHAAVGAVTKGNPFYLPSILAGPSPPLPPITNLIYPYETVRYGWMLAHLPMQDGNLQLNHHLWLQSLAREMRRTLKRYLGMIGVVPEVVALDTDFQAVVAKYNAEYKVSVSPGKLEVSLLVSPPGMVGEVDIRVSANE